jgi:hypothetical protein
MLLDEVRNRAFKDAIEAVVRPGDVVMDAGAGCGILSLFAARAGAKRVYAVEKTETAALACSVVERNGLADRIVVVQADMATVSLPESVDVIVSEWLGTIGVDESARAPATRTRSLSEARRPNAAGTRHGVDGSRHGPQCRCRACFLSRQAPRIRSQRCVPQLAARDGLGTVAADKRMRPGRTAAHVDASRMALPATCAELPFRASLKFRIAAAELDGLALWFHAAFGDGITLTDGPDAPPTHWIQYLLPLEFGGSVASGTTLAVEFACIPALPGYCHNAWSARIAHGRWEHHDTRCA